MSIIKTVGVDMANGTQGNSEMDNIVDLFFEIYPEFVGRATQEQVVAQVRRLYVLYNVLDNGSSEERRIATCMAVAHYLARNSTVTSEGEINGGISGVISSASMGGVSVSMQTPPASDSSEYFWLSTQYGQEFKAWLDGLGGVRYVN